MPKARSHNDLRDSLIALGDRDRSRKRQLAKLHRWACPQSVARRRESAQDDNTAVSLAVAYKYVFGAGWVQAIVIGIVGGIIALVLLVILVAVVLIPIGLMGGN